MSGASDAPLEWRPLTRSASGICAFTVAIGEAASLLEGVVHNANWANAHRIPFLLFRKQTIAQGLHHNWERVSAARAMLRGSDCNWLLHMDADAVVVNVDRSPEELLARLEAEVTASAPKPAMFATCNSPLGAGLDCDTLCCGRSKRRLDCPVQIMDEGPASPYPCMINPAVFLLRNSASGRSLLRAWEAHQSDQKEVFGEQHSLNLLQQQRPELIEVVGGQVMNTHSSFGSRLLTTSDPRVAYDIALRISSSYMPFIAQDPRLNHSKYQQVALEAFGAPLDFKAPHSASDSLRDRLQNGLGECIEDPTAFVCHGFATRPDIKVALVQRVARSCRSRIEQLLLQNQPGLGYRTLNRPTAATLHFTTPANHTLTHRLSTHGDGLLHSAHSGAGLNRPHWTAASRTGAAHGAASHSSNGPRGTWAHRVKPAGGCAPGGRACPAPTAVRADNGQRENQ